MSLFDAFRYDGKRALVVGGASGMGAATAQLLQDAGAEVVVMDFAEVALPGAKAIHVNLADAASIDAALDECGGPVHALFSCAGVADGTPGIEKINFIGHRHLIDRAPFRRPAASGLGDRVHLLGRRPRMGGEPPAASRVPGDAGLRRRGGWAGEHGKADYMFSKQAICAYVARQAFPLLKQGIRINAICPGPTDTPLAQANKEMWLGFGADYRGEVGIEASTPAGAGVSPRVPLQRGGRCDLGRHHGHRRRLLQLRYHRVVPSGHANREVPAGQVLAPSLRPCTSDSASTSAIRTSPPP